MSPPIPVEHGSVIFIPAATATAASAAFPPAASMRCPAAAANGCVHAMMPFVECTVDRRDAKL